MKNMKHPAFWLGIITIILVLIGVGFKSNGYSSSYYIWIAASVIGGIHWIWTIIEVIGRDDMKAFQKRFWLILVVAIPVLGGMLFHVLHQQRNKIVT